MKKKKQELGYTNEMIAQISGVPLGTVQKIFAGITTSPRYDTLQA
ncbi:helix-turn-helix domain-containing protein, partial [Neglectibacter sp. X4]